MGRRRSNASFDLDEERARKRTRVYDKDRIGSAMERKKEDRRDARNGRVVDLKERMNSRHGISGGERYKEEREYERKQNLRDKENKKPRDTSVREPVSRSRELSSCKESSGTDRYKYGKYQDQRPKRKHQDSSTYEHEWYTHEHWYKDEKRRDKYLAGVEREKLYNREDHKYVDKRKSTKCGGEDYRGEKRLYADLKGASKVMRGELDKHVPRHGHRKVEYLSSDNFHKRVSNSGTILIKGQSSNNNLREEEEQSQRKQEEYPHKVLSPVLERSNSPFRLQNHRTNTYPLNSLRYSQPWFPETKDNMMENLTCSSRPAVPHTLSNNNSWNINEYVPFQYWGSQWLGYQAGNSTFCNYGGWEHSYINNNYNFNPNFIRNINNENDSWSKTSNIPLWPSPVPNTSTYWPRPAGFHSTLEQWPIGMRSEIPEWNPTQVSYNSDGEINPLLSKQNLLCWPNNSVPTIREMSPSEAKTADEFKPVMAENLEEGQTVTDACANTDKMEVKGDNGEKLSIEVCLEKSANSDKKQNGAVVPSDDS
ncbi:hypothetical protein FCM35_KLT05668 [Carex littledalei]|uniref:Uncharacterized protein n=1 Tax=Carex littledalei TaxID=544730 RepID=A0A833VJ58_9POAL|nr:hypothetical protein FCM35_KLT05668 [Carex littledalei]